MIIKTTKSVCCSDGGRIVSGVGLRAQPVPGGYKVISYEHTGRFIPADAAMVMSGIDDEPRSGKEKRKYGI